VLTVRSVIDRLNGAASSTLNVASGGAKRAFDAIEHAPNAIENATTRVGSAGRRSGDDGRRPIAGGGANNGKVYRAVPA
jgi:hypothetical protein